MSATQILSVFVLLAFLIMEGSAEMRPKPANNKNILSDTSYVPYRSPEPGIIRQQGNRLKNEKSVYLKQHAYNPVDWFAWGEEAFNRAKADNRPIFLSIGYSSCHWCHVMEEQVFTRDDIALFMNENYINIKLDREERPDIDAVYMDAVQAMTGSGGWPLSVFLTPDLKPFYGDTYYPPDQFLFTINQIAAAYADNKDKIEEAATNLTDILSENLQVSLSTKLSHEMIESLAERAKTQIDKQWGGFSGNMKFPTPIRWQFLLHYYRKNGDGEIAGMLRTTLDNMASGGLFDHIGGGFHRYATDRIWLVPHFEKMLYDNAQLALLYLEASVVFDDPRYSQISRETVDFMIDEMSGEEGGFYSSYDADSDGREGLYYLWSEQEILEVAGEQDGPALAMILGVTPEGNFEGMNVLTRRAELFDIESKIGLNENTISQLFDKYRDKLRNFRDKRTSPSLDRKIIASWNGLAISALAKAYGVFKEDRYIKSAEKAADYLLKIHIDENGGLFRSSYEGKPEHDGVLDDYSFLANGLLDLYQASGNIRYLEKAMELIDYTNTNFSSENGGYFLTHADVDTPIGRKIELFDNVRPSGNAMMVEALVKSGAITGNSGYHDKAGTLVDLYSEIMNKAGIEMAGWLDAAIKLNGPYYELIIAGDDNLIFHKLNSVYWDNLPCHAVLVDIPGDGLRSDVVKSARDKTAIKGLATAYVCKLGTCNLPTSDPEELKIQLINGWVK